MAQLADEIDEDRARRAKERAEKALQETQDDENQVALQRAETRLRAKGTLTPA